MAYIGNPPADRYSEVAYQDLTGETGSPAKRGFTLDYAVGSASEIEVFVNNVRQEPTEAYTVAGTALTMTGDVETTDDFYVVFQGKAVASVLPPDLSITTGMLKADAVTTAKIADDAVTTAKIDDNDRMVDTWYLTASQTMTGTGQLIGSDDSTDLTNQTGIGYVGTSRMSESSGTFTFPKTGVYKISAFLTITADAADGAVRVSIDHNKSGSYVEAVDGFGFHRAADNVTTCHAQLIFDCTNTSTQNVRFHARSANGTALSGGDDPMLCYFIFERIADSQ